MASVQPLSPNGHTDGGVEPGASLALGSAALSITVRAPRAAELLDVSEPWLRKNAARYGIPHATLGGVLLFPVEGLLDWSRSAVFTAPKPLKEQAA